VTNIVGFVIVEYDGYILHVNLPIVFKFKFNIGKHAIYSPVFLPVPKSKSNEFENIISIADVILFIDDD
jgi:hypothetical protein